MSVSSKIAAAEHEETQSQIRWDAEREAYEIKHRGQMEAAKQDMFPYLKEKGAKLYAKWLKKHLEDGGDISHVYNYNMPDIYTAKKGCSTVPLYGASSISIIVPSGVEVDTSAGLGHINIYYMDDVIEDRDRAWFVPLYSDIKARLA